MATKKDTMSVPGDCAIDTQHSISSEKAVSSLHCPEHFIALYLRDSHSAVATVVSDMSTKQ